jgi:hypothetical protein
LFLRFSSLISYPTVLILGAGGGGGYVLWLP